MKGALFEAGVPASVAGQAFTNAASLHASGANATPEAYDAALVKCRAALDKQWGADAPNIARDGLAYFDNLAKNPKLKETVELLYADPWAISPAAQMYRASKR